MRLYSVGDRVSQAKFGDGTVTSSNEYHTVIDFDQHGVRTFASTRVQLVRCSTTAPPKPAKASRRKGN